MYVPEIENSILSVPPLVPLHVTVEATTAVIRNVDSSIRSPLTFVLFVSFAVAVILPSILVLVSTVPRIFAVDN
jgi:hypothetical protein